MGASGCAIQEAHGSCFRGKGANHRVLETLLSPVLGDVSFSSAANLLCDLGQMVFSSLGLIFLFSA